MSAASIYTRLAGAFLGLGGIWFLINPGFMTELYHVKFPTPQAEATVRSFLGGGQLAAGLMFLFHNNFLGIPLRGAMNYGFLLLLCILSGKVLTWIMGSPDDFNSFFYIETAGETLMALGFLFLRPRH